MARYHCPAQETVALWLLQAPHWRPWSLEAPVRAYLRAHLCLQGSRWRKADERARTLVARARSITNGAPAPRGWDADNPLEEWLPRGCEVCDHPFHPIWPEQKFCSRACRKRAEETERWAIERVGACEPPRCSWCRALFDPDHPGAKFCSARCRDHLWRFDLRERADVLLGEEIANRRRDAGWTQPDLARRLDITFRYLAAIEHGRTAPSQELLERIWSAIEDLPTGRTCDWCGGEIPPGKSPVALFCSRDHAIAASNARRRRRLGLNGEANGHDQDAVMQSDAQLHHNPCQGNGLAVEKEKAAEPEVGELGAGR